MNLELKKAIFNYMADNQNEFQLVNSTTKKFSQYLYTPEGEYCFGGKAVSEFICQVDKLLRV